MKQLRLCVLALSILLVWGGSPASAQTRGSPLTPELLAKLTRLVYLSKHEGPTPPATANALGLAAPEQGWRHRFASAQDNNTGVTHSFAIGADDAQTMTFSASDPTQILAIRILSNGAAGAALSIDPKTKVMTLQNPAQADAEFQAECAYWTANIDDLTKQALADASKAPSK